MIDGDVVSLHPFSQCCLLDSEVSCCGVLYRIDGESDGRKIVVVDVRRSVDV